MEEPETQKWIFTGIGNLYKLVNSAVLTAQKMGFCPFPHYYKAFKGAPQHHCQFKSMANKA